MPPQLKNMSARYKFMNGCEFCVSVKSMNSYLLSWRDFYLEKLKGKSHNAKSRMSDEMDSHIFETYQNYGMSH